MARPNAGDDSNPRSGEGGARRTPAQLAVDPAFTGAFVGLGAVGSLTRRATGAICVANRSGVPLTQAASAAGQFVRLLYTAAEDITSLQVVLPNWYIAVNVPDEAAGANAITVRAYVEPLAGWWKYVSASTAWTAGTYNAGDQVTRTGVNYVCLVNGTTGTPQTFLNTPWRATTPQLLPFTGAATTGEVTINPGETATSQPFSVFIPKGQRFAISLLVIPAGGTGQWPTGVNTRTGSAAATPDWVKAGATDYAATPPTTTTSDADVAMYQPLAVVGTTGKSGSKCIALVGDSIVAGSGESASSIAPDPGGYLARAVAGAGLPYLRIARPSGQVSQLVDGRQRAHRRFGLLRYGTHIVSEMGTNDVGTGSTVALIQSQIIDLWRTCNAVAPTWQTLITPRTTSTDSWATVGNQTASSNFGASSNWSNLNAWLSDGAPIDVSTWVAAATGATASATVLRAGTSGHPLQGVIDVVSVIVDTTVTWAWKAGYTADGTHPTSAAHALMAAAINTAIFT